MLKLNIAEKRSLSFDVDIENIDYKQLEGSFKFILDEIEVGIPIKVLGDSILVNIPALNNHIKNMTNDKVVKGVLEVHGSGFHLKPWEGEFQISGPVKVEAKVHENSNKAVLKGDEPAELAPPIPEEESESIPEDSKDEIKIAQKSIDTGETHVSGDDETKDYDDDVITRSEMKKMLEDIIGTKKEKIVEKPKPEKLVTIHSKSGKIYNVTEKVANKIKKLESKHKKKINESKPIGPSTEITNDALAKKLNQLKSKAGITTEMDSRFAERSGSGITDPRKLMESMGMKNSKIQDIMIEKATEKGGDDPDSQFDVLKKMLQAKGEN
jgi:hypothetical protein